jgi:hypothetical protein
MQHHPDQVASQMNPRLSRSLVLAFFLLGLLLIGHHELWQDEWQAWLIARDSATIADLFNNLRYEGHPGLWHLGLFVLSRFTQQPLPMQVLHLVLATATVYVFLKFSPFTNLQKILFVFGYFPFFEYAAISRNYAPGILLLFLFCAVFPSALRKKFLVLCGILFLLAQTSVYGLFLVLALGLALVVTAFADKSFAPGPSPLELLTGLALMAAGVCLSIVQLVPPPDSGVALGWTLDFVWPHFIRVVATFWESFVPIPALQYHFWDTNLISDPYLKFFLSLPLLAFSFALFLRQPLLLCLFGFGTLEILTFGYTKYFGSIRHHGHLFILFLACLWLSASLPSREVKAPLAKRLTDFCRRNKDRFVVGLLAVHLLAGIMAYGMDLAYPFSAGRETARYIKENHLDHLLLAGDEDDAASVLAGYLNRKIYYPGSHRWGSFMISDRKRQSLKDSEILKKTRQLAARHHREVLLIMNRELADPAHQAVKLAQFTDSMVPAEKYYLYLVRAGD